MNDQIRPKCTPIVVRFAVQQPDEAVRTLNVQIDVSSLKGQHGFAGIGALVTLRDHHLQAAVELDNFAARTTFEGGSA